MYHLNHLPLNWIQVAKCKYWSPLSYHQQACRKAQRDLMDNIDKEIPARLDKETVANWSNRGDSNYWRWGCK